MHGFIPFPPLPWIIYVALAIGVIGALLGWYRTGGLRNTWYFLGAPLVALALTWWIFSEQARAYPGHYDLGPWASLVFLPLLLFVFVVSGFAWLVTMALLRFEKSRAAPGRIPWTIVSLAFCFAVGAWVFLIRDPLTQRLGSGTLHVRTDAYCFLSVDGSPIGHLLPGQDKSMQVEAGLELVDCYNPSHPEIRTRAMVTLKRQGEASVTLHPSEVPSQPDDANRYEAADGVVSDHITGLQWQQTDNGAKIVWKDAQAYCRRLGRDWRLPRAGELISLDNRSQTLPGDCGNPDCPLTGCRVQRTCHVSPLFRLSGSSFWTGKFDPGYTRYVNFYAADRIDNTPPSNPEPRALCVRDAR